MKHNAHWNAKKMRRMKVDSPISGRALTLGLTAALTAVLMIALPSLSQAGDVFNGKQIYKDHCAICHGASGVAEVGNAPDFSRGEGLMQADVSLLEKVSNGKNAMPGYRGMLTDQEILDVISYIRILF